MTDTTEHPETRSAMADAAEQSLEIGGRISEAPSERMVATAFKEELSHQIRLNRAIGLADMAHTVMAMEAGIVPQPEGIDLLSYLHRLHCNPDQLQPDPERGDLYTNRESWLRTHSESVKWLGIGRARREATTTAFFITVRGLLLELQQALADYARALAQKSEQCADALMPDYTYLQPAQPTRFGHYLLGYGFALMRDMARLQPLFERINRSPAGCGSSNGSRLAQDRERLADLLGFEGLVTHARDAMWQADLPVEIASVLCAIVVNLDRLAEDLQVFSTQEFGLVELHDCHARASKILPQKKNPFALTHIRAVANEMIGLSASTAAAGRTPSGQPDNRLSIYGTVPSAIEKTTGVVALMSETASLLRFNLDAGRQKLRVSGAQATDLAEALITMSGLDPRAAHRLVGAVVRNLNRSNAHLADLELEGLKRLAKAELGVDLVLDANTLAEALCAESSVEAKDQPGGCSRSAMQRMLEEIRECAANADAWLLDKQRRIDASERRLLVTVAGIARR